MAGGHLARSGEGQKGALKTFFLTMGLGILAMAAGAPDAGAALMYSANYFATLNYLGYSRIQEAQADQPRRPIWKAPRSPAAASSISSTTSATRRCSRAPTAIRSSRTTP